MRGVAHTKQQITKAKAKLNKHNLQQRRSEKPQGSIHFHTSCFVCYKVVTLASAASLVVHVILTIQRILKEEGTNTTLQTYQHILCTFSLNSFYEKICRVKLILSLIVLLLLLVQGGFYLSLFLFLFYTPFCQKIKGSGREE